MMKHVVLLIHCVTLIPNSKDSDFIYVYLNSTFVTCIFVCVQQRGIYGYVLDLTDCLIQLIGVIMPIWKAFKAQSNISSVQ